MNLDSHKGELGKCTYCPKLCRFCCPTAEVEHSETVTPWAKMSLAEMVRLGRLDAGGDAGEVFYHCFTCLHCRTHCTHGVDVPGSLVEARSAAMGEGGEPTAVSALVGRFHDSGNVWGEDLQASLRKQLPESLLVSEAQAVLFPGCDTIRQDGFLLKIFELLSKLGVDYVGAYAGEKPCCGIPLRQAGDREGFLEHARMMRSQLTRYRTVISPCPTCVYAFRALYAELDLAPGARILHLTEFLESLLEDREPAKMVPGAHVFHDPCYLARFLDKPDLPRKLLARVLEEPLTEPAWTGPDATCCGGGGLVPQVLPEVAAGAAAMRMEQLRATGAKRVITACPGCLQRLSDSPGALPVCDLSEVLLDAL